MSELSGRLIVETPVAQFAEPAASLATRLMTQVLVTGLLTFGIGSGGPKRHPGRVGYSGLLTEALVHVRFGCAPPMSVSVVGASVSSQMLWPLTLVTEVPMSGTVAGSGTLSR